MSKVYCKWCGGEFHSIQQMTGGGVQSCPNNPNGSKKHELYEGSEKSEYFCKWCGGKFQSIKQMTGGGVYSCSKNPNGKKHEPAL